MDVVILQFHLRYLPGLYSMLGSMVGTEKLMVDEIQSFPSVNSN